MEFQSRIEEELRCPRCRQLYVDAVLLSCDHSVCLQCAVQLAKDCPSSTAVFAGKSSPNGQPRPDSLTVPGGAGPAAGAENACSPGVGGGTTSRSESDRSSVASETDSGVICTAAVGPAGSSTPSATAGSRPNSFVGADGVETPSVGNLSTTSSQDSGSSSSSSAAQIVCPRCRRTTGVEDPSAVGLTASLPRNRCLEAVVDRYRDSRQIPILCQSCVEKHGKDDGVEEDPERVETTATDSAAGSSRAATGLCERCLMFLCDRCAEADRGHGSGCPSGERGGQTWMSPTSAGKSWLAAVGRSRACSCADHADETLSLYCADCRAPVCFLCADVSSAGRHASHCTRPLGSMSRSYKVSHLCPSPLT